ncbi:hypothetical protein [Geomicrobium sp. JCM 19039]|uniref:hypothetical protein n=1 Tax=Geomicrobium sp. JCM 19039 TaxID=1460636 RepID=UPI00045F230C|nr:hypothetical protein [Geomicrobium sp. JCM 19039]GAK12468.1 hypothetical protein JCM19039_2244 [Geomicrobium sp. JCM 19039]
MWSDERKRNGTKAGDIKLIIHILLMIGVTMATFYLTFFDGMGVLQSVSPTIAWGILFVHVVSTTLAFALIQKLDVDLHKAGVLFIRLGAAMIVLTLGVAILQATLFIITGIIGIRRMNKAKAIM